jgi:hypothetical protein
MDTTEKILQLCGIQQRKTLALWDTMKENLSNIPRLFLKISHNEGKPLLLYPTTEENFLHCIPQWRKTSFAVPHNG